MSSMTRQRLQAGCAPDRFILIPFLDERHDPVALPQRQSIPPSQIARLPQPKRRMRAYHAFIQAGVVAQGLLQYLAVAAPKLVWSSFGSWLRTIRPDIPPSEFVVAKALRQTLPEFLMGPAKSDSLTKFIAERQDMQNMPIFRLAS